MAFKWMMPRFRKKKYDEMVAAIDALPTSAETNAAHPSSAYCTTWYVDSA
jgi:hypothetical protein